MKLRTYIFALLLLGFTGVALALPTTTYSPASSVPTTDNTYDLGTAALRWRNLYLAGASIFSQASTTQLTNSGSTWLTSILSKVLSVDANGLVYGASTSTPSVTYPVQYSGTLGQLVGGASGAFSLAFGTTTANTWSGLQAFTNTGTTTFSGGIDFTRFNFSATSTGSQGINLSAGCFAVGGTCLQTFIQNATAYKQAAKYATAAILPGTPTYSNGVSGVGATLTEVGLGALVVDGQSVSAGDRILVKNEASQPTNGVYTVTTVGSAIANYVLTRATDYDESADVYAGTTIPILAGGTANGDTQWTQTTTGTITMGSSNIAFEETALGTAVVSSIAQTYGTAQTGAITIATSSDTNVLLNVSNSSGAFTFAPSWTGNLAIARGGTATTTQVTNGVNFFDGTRITSGTKLTFTGTNLGISSTTPNYPLDVNGTGHVTNLDIADTGQIAWGGTSVNRIVGSNSANSLTFNTNSATALTIASNQLATFTGGITLAGRLTQRYTSTNLLDLDTTNANGGYGLWSTSGTVNAYFGSAKQLLGSLAAADFGIDTRGSNFYLLIGGNVVQTVTSAGASITGTLGTSDTVSITKASATARMLNMYNSSLGYSEIKNQAAAADVSYGAGIRFQKDATGSNYGSSIAFLNETDNGASDDYAVRMTLKGNNLGIGTTTPFGKFQVAGDVSTDPATGAYGQVEITGTTDPSKRLALGYNTSSNYAFIQSLQNGVAYRNLALQGNGGNVGIGTASPGFKLDVNGDKIRIANTTSAGSYATRADFIQFNRTDLLTSYTNKITNSFSNIAGDTTMNFELTNAAGSGLVTDLTLTGAGNAGVGTSTPNSRLDVGLPADGSIGFKVNDASGYGIFTSAQNTLNFNYGSNATSDGYINYHGYIDGTSQFRNLHISNGKQADIAYFDGVNSRVGVGTASPSQKLEVFSGALHVANGTGSNYVTRNDAIIFNRSDVPTTFTNKITSSHSNVASDSAMFFEVNDGTSGGISTVLTLNGAGNVGIGTTSPLAVLHVNGANVATGAAYNTFGNLFVGTSNAMNTNIGGAISLGGYGNTSGAGSIYTFARIQGKKENNTGGNSAGYLAFETDANASNTLVERMRISSTGNIGLGTNAPASLVEIAGDLNVTGTDRKINIGTTLSAGKFGFLAYDSTSDFMYLGTSHGGAFNNDVKINSSGNVTVAGTLTVTGLVTGSAGYTPKVATYTAASTTPSVIGATFMYVANSGATTITNFLGGVEGQQLCMLFADGNTTFTRANAYLNGSSNYTSVALQTLCLVFHSPFWYEVSRTTTNG